MTISDAQPSNGNEELKNKQENISEPHTQAEIDIEKDPDLKNKPDLLPNLGKGESARLSGENSRLSLLTNTA